MKVRLYAVLDSASGVYDGPFPVNSDGVALRNFTNMAMNKESPIGKNPECFSIWKVGEYDDSVGAVKPVDKVCLAYAIDVLKGDSE